jgi:glycosyltransferase involved in cell wall biosynthesis
MYDYVDEIVCLDAGSKDDTLNILKRYDKVRYYVIPQPSSIRGSSGWHEGDRRNILQSTAKGEWLLCLGCDELMEDVVWEKIHTWLVDENSLGFGFLRINYVYNFNWHKPINLPNNRGEVRIYRNSPLIKWETNNAHNFLRFYNDLKAADKRTIQNSVRMCDHPQVVKTKFLIHHMHRVGIRGHKPVHDRRHEMPGVITKEYVKTHSFHKTVDNKYPNPIKYPKILYDKGIL